MEQIKQEVKACGEKSDCLDKLDTKIEEDVVVLPKRVTDSGTQNIFAILALRPKTNSCCKKAYDDFEVRGTKMYDDILTCIKSKF